MVVDVAADGAGTDGRSWASGAVAVVSGVSASNRASRRAMTTAAIAIRASTATATPAMIMRRLILGLACSSSKRFSSSLRSAGGPSTGATVAALSAPSIGGRGLRGRSGDSPRMPGSRLAGGAGGAVGAPLAAAAALPTDPGPTPMRNGACSARPQGLRPAYGLGGPLLDGGCMVSSRKAPTTTKVVAYTLAGAPRTPASIDDIAPERAPSMAMTGQDDAFRSRNPLTSTPCVDIAPAPPPLSALASRANLPLLSH